MVIEKPIRLIQISDLHFFADPNQTLLGVKTQESFQAVLDFLFSKNESPDSIILSGDLSQDHTLLSYQYIAQALKPLSVPVYFLPGNHDDFSVFTPQAMATMAPLTSSKQIIIKNWQIILLNSQKKGRVEGFLKPEELLFLKNCLESHPAHFAIVMLHHHPVNVACAWLEPIGLTNAAELWVVLKNYPRIKTILFGHVHQEISGIQHEIPYYSAPSTCIQFKRQSDTFALENIPPGYRWIDLYPDGQFRTEVCRIPHYIGEFLADSQGY